MTTKSTDKNILAHSVTRRDFVNTTLIGAGAALLHTPNPAFTQKPPSGWNGYSGVGDFRHSNGETWDTMESAHAIRDAKFEGQDGKVIDTGQTYDLVIVGGGFAGLGALHEFRKRHPNGTCLLLDNQEIFGGNAKANEFDVDGYRVAGPQASLNFMLPGSQADRDNGYWTELGLPDRFQFVERSSGNPEIKFPKSTSAPLYLGEQTATVGYYFKDRDETGKWVNDIWRDDLARAPWSQSFKEGLLAFRSQKLHGKPDDREALRLDGITFADYATNELKVPPEVLSYITQGMCVTGPQISAYAARSLPGLMRFADGGPEAEVAERFMSFPTGNAVLVRHFVKAAFPDAIRGSQSFEQVASAPLNLASLDRVGAACRMRLRATAIRVKHEGNPKASDHVSVVYEKGGRLFRVEAKGVVIGIGSWVTKHIVADLPTARRAALDQFLYAPILMVNVALRNWRFLDRLGFSTARWFDGFGFFCATRQPMAVGPRAAPFHPDKPIVMTIYVPMPNPDLPLEAQGPAGRAQLYGTTYADYEKLIVAQMTQMFSLGGFDARRDIAGIVLNRWGHAFVTPPPGFFFGRDGAPAPVKLAIEPFGRVAFGPTGLEDWLSAAQAGKRAVGQLGSVL